MISIERFIDPSGPASEIAETPITSCRVTERVRNTAGMILSGFNRIMVMDNLDIRGYVTSLDVLDFLGGGPRHQQYVGHSKGLDISVGKIMNTDFHPLDKKHSVEDALRVFQKHGNEFHPIVHNNKLFGILSERDFIRNISKPVGLSIGDFMNRKPIIAKSHYSVNDTAKMLVRGDYRFLPVIKNDFVLGVVTPHDIISYLNNGLGLDNLRKADFEVTAAMNRNFISVEPDDDVYAAVKLMNEKGIGNLPVTDEGEMMGLITRRDIVDMLS